MLKTNTPGNDFDKVFSSCLAKSSNTDICVGYCSIQTVAKYRKTMINAASRGRLRLIVGMYSAQGNFPAKLYSALMDLHRALSAASAGSGVFVTICDYHGKIYAFDPTSPSAAISSVWLGSSNFSPFGLGARLEACAKLSDPQTIREATDYIDFLCKKKSVPITGVTFTKPPVSAAVSLNKLPYLNSLPASLVLDGSMSLPLNVDSQPQSGLNLCKGAGRKSGLKFTPRNWYEVEISSSLQTRNNPLYPKADNAIHQKRNAVQKTSNHCEFAAYLTDGSHYWKCRLSTYSDGYKAMGSNPRELLGQFLKGMLELAGVLKRGETITGDTLALYGRNDVTLSRYTDTSLPPDPEGKLRDKVFVLSFEKP